MDCDLPPPAIGLLRGETRVVVPSLVEEFLRAVRQPAPGKRWNRINDSPQLGWRFERRFRCTHRFSFGPPTETLHSRYSPECQPDKSSGHPDLRHTFGTTSGRWWRSASGYQGCDG